MQTKFIMSFRTYLSNNPECLQANEGGLTSCANFPRWPPKETNKCGRGNVFSPKVIVKMLSQSE